MKAARRDEEVVIMSVLHWNELAQAYQYNKGNVAESCQRFSMFILHYETRGLNNVQVWSLCHLHICPLASCR